MRSPGLGLAALGAALMVGIGLPGGFAAADGGECETTSVHAYTGGLDPVSFDRSGNVLVRVWGSEGSLLVQPDGSAVDLTSLESLPGDWIVDGTWMTLMPSGTVLGNANNYDVSESDPGWRRSFIWKGRDLIWLRGGLNTVAKDTNSSGAIVGYEELTMQQLPTRAVYWSSSGTKPRPLPTPSRFTESKALDIERDGTIHGWALRDDGTAVWVVWRGDDLSVQRLPAGFRVSEIEAGRIAGSITNSDGIQRPAYFDSHGLWLPEIPDGATGRVRNVTANGAFAGDLWKDGSWTSFIGRPHEPLLWSEQPVQELRSFDNVSSLTRDGWITRCLYP